MDSMEESCALRLQSWWRGTSVRRKLANVREEYETVVRELEGEGNTEVFWKDDEYPCLPALYTVGRIPPNLKKINRRRPASMKTEQDGDHYKTDTMVTENEVMLKDEKQDRTRIITVNKSASSCDLLVSSLRDSSKPVSDSEDVISHREQSVRLSHDSNVSHDSRKSHDSEEFSVQTHESEHDDQGYRHGDHPGALVDAAVQTFPSDKYDSEVISDHDIKTSKEASHIEEKPDADIMPNDEAANIRGTHKSVSCGTRVDSGVQVTDSTVTGTAAVCDTDRQDAIPGVINSVRSSVDKSEDFTIVSDLDITVSDTEAHGQSFQRDDQVNAKQPDSSPDVHDSNQVDVQAHNNNTSIWDTAGESRLNITETTHQEELSLPLTAAQRKQLEEERTMLSMELVWVQQAINSRKQYLRLRKQMTGTSSG